MRISDWSSDVCSSDLLKVRDPADRSAPVVALSNGIAGSIFDGAASVAGSVTDSNLDEWTLELLASDGTVTLLGRGDAAIDGELGSLDARSFADGFYTLRLTARDISGRVSVTVAQVECLSEFGSTACRERGC